MIRGQCRKCDSHYSSTMSCANCPHCGQVYPVPDNESVPGIPALRSPVINRYLPLSKVPMKHTALKMAVILASLAFTVRADEGVRSPGATDDISVRLESLEKFKSSFDRLKFEAFTHLRYDSQDSRKVRGAYARRAEVKVVGKVFDGGSAVLGYDFVENKLKDYGLEEELPSLGLKIQLGQFRQKFGVEPQQGSAKVWFAERALIFGGAQPLIPNAKIVGERAMGLHGIKKQAMGPLGFELAASFANNLTEDQAAGKNKIGATDAFPKQLVDENPSLTLRLGTDLSLSPLKVGFGASYSRDSQNTVFLASKSSDQKAEEFNGLDLTLAFSDLWKVQAEWVCSNASQSDRGVTLRREGWYVQQSFQPLPLLSKDLPKVELLARYDSTIPNVHASVLPESVQAATGALKWGFAGSQYLILQYSAYAYSNDFGAAAGTELWVLQQQLMF